jgi:hypothetical protein
MKIIACAVVLFCLGLPSTLFAPYAALAASPPARSGTVGFAHDETFIVYAPDQALADQVLAKANEFRKAESKDMLGKELESGKGRTIITVELSATEDSGFTWPIDHPDRKFHNMWLTTSRERAAGSTLRHEIRHVVLNTRFPDRLPLWIEEGLASRSDDAQRQQVWRDTAAGFSRSNWPDINAVMATRSIHSTDQATYGASTSLVNYLLTRGDMSKLLEFAVLGKKSGWNGALDQCYGIRSVGEFESQWHAWVDEKAAHARATSPRPLGES